MKVLLSATLLLVLVTVAWSLGKSDNRADDLCAQKKEASTYCFDGDVFNATRCSQEIVTKWLDDYDIEVQKQSYKDQDAQWNYVTNIKDETKAISNQVSQQVANWMVSKLVEALRFPRSTKYYDNATVAQLTRITTSNALCDEKEIARKIELDNELAEGYSTIEACFYDVPSINRCLKGQSDFANEMAKQEDYEILRKLWVSYYNGSAPFRSNFAERVKLLNKGASENGFRDNGYYEWFADVGDADFLDKMKKLLTEIDPLYRELHAYVRYRLSLKYPGKVDMTKPIPVHLTRNMYGQTWSDLIGLVKPFPSIPDTDITPKVANYTARKIFDTSEEFFTSIGAAKMTDVFWNKSMIERPSDGRIVECHGSAWDLHATDDYRIKMCTVPTTTEFVTVHHEMGHIVYYMAYRPQKYIYRDGAQSGFHEAIGDTIALSVLTPEHLKTIGLLSDIPSGKEGEEFDVNFLMATALEKLPFFSFSLMMDLWRWGTFDGSIPESRYNADWWRMRLEMGGVVPPPENDRYSEAYFDPGAKYHVTNNVPYIRYFMSFFLQFQFYESMCKLANHSGPLHRCDFYRSKEAGGKLLEMLSKGKSTNWHEQLQFMTGSSEIESGAILRYFEPLRKWLTDYNDKNGVTRGWDVPTTSSTATITTTTAATLNTTTSEGAVSRLNGYLIVLSLFLLFRF